MSTPLAQQSTGKSVSSSSATTTTFSFVSRLSNSNSNSNAPQIQAASAQTLFQTPPSTPKSLNCTKNGIATSATSKEGDSTGAPAQKTLGPMPHPDFTFDDGNITLQAGHMTFTVHRYFLVQHSTAFKDMFSLGPESTTEGTKEIPIVLRHLEALDFESFLKVLYPRRFDELPLKTATEWHSVLLVADMFEFRECGIRKLAIEQLEKTASCVQKIIWGEKYGIKSLLIQGYGEACNRKESLTAFEILMLYLHPQAVELIMRKREELLYSSERCVRCPRTRAQVSDDELGLHFRTQLKNAH